MQTNGVFYKISNTVYTVYTLDKPFGVYESLLVSHQGDLDIPV